MQNQDIKQLVLDAAHRRRAIKFFDPEKKISDDDINYILETAPASPLAPSALRVGVSSSFRTPKSVKRLSPSAGAQLASSAAQATSSCS